MDQKSFENKIYSVRSLEGRQNTREISEIREIEGKLKEIPGFVAIIGEGSTFKGYSVETSDIDLLILFDSSQGRKDQSQEIKADLAKVFTDAKESIWQQRSREGKRMKNIAYRLRDLSDAALEGAVARHDVGAFADLFKLSTGDKIKKYRDLWFKAINNLDSKEREKLIDEIASLLTQKDFDDETFEKRVQPDNKDAITEARRVAWRRRVENMLEPQY